MPSMALVLIVVPVLLALPIEAVVSNTPWDKAENAERACTPMDRIVRQIMKIRKPVAHHLESQRQRCFRARKVLKVTGLREVSVGQQHSEVNSSGCWATALRNSFCVWGLGDDR